MPNRVTQLMLSELETRYRDAKYIMAVGFEGLSGEETYAFRGVLADSNLEMRVVRNRLTEIAFNNLGIEGVGNILSGETALVVGEDPVSMARTIRDFAKAHEQVNIRGAVVESEVLDQSRAKSLADMESREETVAKIAGLGMSMGGKVAGAITSQGSALAGCLKSLIEKLEKESA